MKKQLLISVAVIVGFVLVAAFLISRRPAPPIRTPEQVAPLVQTAAIELRSGAIPVSGYGTVRPRAEVSLAPQVGGVVTYVHPELVSGGSVRSGTVLVRIDEADYRHAVEQARADVAQQEVAVLQAEEETQIAEREYERFRSRESARGAAGSVPQAAPQNRLVFREPQLKAARAALARAQAQLANAELALSRTEVRAPFSALVRSETVDIGSYMTPGQPFAQLVASDIVEVIVPLSRSEASLIPDLWTEHAAGSIAAKVFVEYGGVEYFWNAYVHRAEAVLDEQTRTIDVVIRVPDPLSGGIEVMKPRADERLGPKVVPDRAPPMLVGEFVRAEIDGANLEQYVVVPREALRPGDDIWIVEQGTLAIVPVGVIQQIEESAYLLAEGLRDDQHVVTSDLNVAIDGMRVRIMDQPAADAPASSEPANPSLSDR